MKEFRVNQYITLKLEKNNTVIYVNGKHFDQCKFLLLNIPVNKYEDFNDIESIDEAAARLDPKLEGGGKKNIEIPAEVEFWGHSSNLQVWVENNYDTRLLHRSLAFPLLRSLADLGDPLAKLRLKEEIVERFRSGSLPVVEYLINEGYLRYFKNEEIIDIFLESKEEREAIKDIKNILKKDFDLKAELDFYAEREQASFYYKSYFSISIQNKHITGIDLTSCYLKEIPNPIFELSFLKKLYLDHNEIVIVPGKLGGLINLKEFSIRDNKIKDFPNSMAKLKSLEKIGMERNDINQIPDNFCKMNSLKHVFLGNNNIEKIPDKIDKLKKLKRLNLEDNQINELPETIGNLRLLEGLNLENNYIARLPRSILNLKSPIFIRMIHNPLDSETQEFIKEIRAYKKYIITKNGEKF